MTPAQVRDAIEAALAALPVNGTETAVPIGGDKLVVTAGDCRYVITVKAYRRQP